MAKLPLLALVLSAAAVAGASTSPQSGPAESPAIKKVRASVAILAEAGRFLGSAVLIGEDGRFLAHRSAIRGIGPDGIIATLADGRKVRLFIESRDVPTQFVLLQAKPWPGGVAPVKPLTGNTAPNTALVAILGDRTFQAQVSPRDRIGIDRGTSRMLPLTELTFEGTNGIVGGAALFTPAGEFVGYVTAVLTGSEALASGLRSVGPSNLVIGYSVAPDVTRRAVEGFLSPSKRPQVASVGIVCKDAPKPLGALNGGPGGALVEAIDPTSPAARAGIMLNDVIVQIGERPIGNQIDFAKTLYALKPGTKVDFQIRRGASNVTVTVELGLAPASAGPGGE